METTPPTARSRTFIAMAYSREDLVAEAESLAGEWVAAWLNRQKDEVFQGIANEFRFNVEWSGGYLEALCEALLAAYLRDAYAAAASARDIDPLTARVALEDGVRLTDNGTVSSGSTLCYFDSDGTSMLRVPALVMRQAWPEYEGDWDRIEQNARARSGLPKPQASSRFTALRKDFKQIAGASATTLGPS